MTTREEVHQIVDQLPESELHAAKRMLAYLRDVGQLPRFLAEAPIDDEPETEEERLAVEEARQAIARGEVVPWSEVRNRYVRDE